MWGEFQKFGLRYCDLPTMMWNVAFMLRVLTLNIDPRNKKSIPIIFYIATLTLGTSYFYVYGISMTWFVFKRCRETGEVLCAIVVFSLGVTSEIGVTKLICMFVYQKKLRHLVADYLACDALVDPGSRFAVNLAKTLRLVKRRALVFWLVIMGNGTIYIMKPLITPGRHLMEDCFVFYGLEPMFESPHYEIALLANIFSVICTCYLPANITGFFIILAGYIEAQILALSEELRHLWDDAEEYYRELQMNIESDAFGDRKQVILNEYVKNRLIEIVKLHKTNINLVRRVETVFRGVLAAEFIILIIGLIAILLGGLENTYIQLPYALILIGIDCLVGHRLLDASLTFKHAVYSCKWENFDVFNRKIVLLMLQSAQKGLTLSAGGIATLSYVCFMSVIRSIYSAYTALRSTI